MKLLIRVLVTAAAVAITAWLFSGITVSGDSAADKALTLLVVAVIFGLVNALVKPVFSALTGCLIVITLGLFLFVINALMLMLTSWIAGQLNIGFHVDGFWWALIGSVVISLISGFANGVLGTRRGEESRD